MYIYECAVHYLKKEIKRFFFLSHSIIFFLRMFAYVCIGEGIGCRPVGYGD